MATLETMPAEVRNFLRVYQWRRIDPVPWATVQKPLSQSRVGLVVAACMVNPGEKPFHAQPPDFDASMRIVDSRTDPETLVNTYPGQAFDHAGLQADANLLIPLDRLHDMEATNEIGAVAPRTVSLCGHLPKPDKLIDSTAPQIAQLFREDQADVVMLVPA